MSDYSVKEGDIPSKEELDRWIKENGLEKFKDSDFIVNGIEMRDGNIMRISAFVNVYMENGDLFSAHILFDAQKRDE